MRYSNVLFAPMSRSFSASRRRPRPSRFLLLDHARGEERSSSIAIGARRGLLVLRVVVLGVLGDVANSRATRMRSATATLVGREVVDLLLSFS